MQVNDFDDFLNGSESLAEKGRALYKYGFGAWISVQLRTGLTTEILEKIYSGYGQGNDPLTIHYSDPIASLTHWHKYVSGVKVGSIIEGADYECQTKILEFPFTVDEFNEAYAELEAEHNYHWKLNNSIYFTVKGPDQIVIGSTRWVMGAEFPDTGDPNDIKLTEGESIMRRISVMAGTLAADIDEGQRADIKGYPGYYVERDPLPEAI